MIGLDLKESQQTHTDDAAWPDEKSNKEPDFVPIAYMPPSVEESARRSGLAYSAGIVLVVSVVFMLFLGWGADLLFGSSPWGLVAGIVLGAIIGFVQFVRITSRIFPPKNEVPAIRPLMSRDEDDDT
jgi:F0F1-type ATP synthase assembly protein I